MLFRPIRQLADRFNVLQMGMVASERVFKVLDTDDTTNLGNMSLDIVGVKLSSRMFGLLTTMKIGF